MIFSLSVSVYKLAPVLLQLLCFTSLYAVLHAGPKLSPLPKRSIHDRWMLSEISLFGGGAFLFRNIEAASFYSVIKQLDETFIQRTVVMGENCK